MCYEEDEKGKKETANGDLRWLQEKERRRGKELEGKDGSELDRREQSRSVLRYARM